MVRGMHSDRPTHDEAGAAASSAVELVSLRAENAMLRAELEVSRSSTATSLLQFAVAMVQTLDARDSYTADHSAAVAIYTADIARHSALDPLQCKRAHLAGLLHDVGKIGVRDHVLNKQGKLTVAEYEEMKAHPVTGADVLGAIDAYADLSLYVRHHHERIDGTGYPDRIAGDAIPLVSRMISVADTYSAMTTDRSYREGMPPHRAMHILNEAAQAGQLDRDLTAQFLRVLRYSNDSYQRGKLPGFEIQAAQHQTLTLTSIFDRQALGTEAETPAELDGLKLDVGDGIVIRTLDAADAAAFFATVEGDREHLRTWLTWVDEEVSERTSVAHIERARQWLHNRQH
ncbi:MAG: response regulator receiver modulated metal dependent phosphohydrolase, partial [Thermoleophilia bacterium]|nr:response regulator receiver modulated metal dependent phosphohydrolase [Thermoleophilia bacterium]